MKSAWSSWRKHGANLPQSDTLSPRVRRQSTSIFTLLHDFVVKLLFITGATINKGCREAGTMLVRKRMTGGDCTISLSAIFRDEPVALPLFARPAGAQGLY
ncbi:MAG: hypothetical protein ACKVOB_07185 [Sphingomonas sp.]